MPSGEHERYEQLPDGEAAEHEAGERLRAGPSAERAQERAEREEERPRPARAPVVARDERDAFRDAFRRDDDQGSVAGRELLVELHLRAELVLGGDDASVAEPHLQVLRSELYEPVQLESRVVRLHDPRALRPRPVVRKAARTRREQEPRAREREDDGWDGLTRRTPSLSARCRCSR